MGEQEQEFLSILAFIHLRHGKAGPAIPLLEALQCLKPKDRHVARSLAYAYLIDGNYATCLKIVEALLTSVNEVEAAGLNLIRRRAQHGLAKTKRKSSTTRKPRKQRAARENSKPKPTTSATQ